MVYSFQTLLSFFVLFSSTKHLTHTEPISRTIDVTYGDESTGNLPVYYSSDSSVWERNYDASQGCQIVPDKTRTQVGT
ncbi:hypothetical protein L218DRAFT_957589 [Marasmius fiardii PR-910]|nr:hypothetical protein L218DRAFT_957589 [Marasmius fiardii PR-910]